MRKSKHLNEPEWNANQTDDSGMENLLQNEESLC